MRWADGRSDKAGGVLDGQTGGRAPQSGAGTTMPRRGPSWDAMAPFFLPLPSAAHVQTASHAQQTRRARGSGGERGKKNKKQKAVAAICGVDLRIFVLRRCREVLQEAEVAMERNPFLVSPPW